MCVVEVICSLVLLTSVYRSLSGIFCVHYLLLLQWRGECWWNNIHISNNATLAKFVFNVIIHFLSAFQRFCRKSVLKTVILLVIVLSQVQTEIRKTWLRWTLAFDWKGPFVLANYRYGTVLNSSGTRVQSHLTSVTRSSALLDSSVYHSAAQPSVGSLAHGSQIHTTLPGYVFSNSDIESLPPSIPEEIEEEAKHIDDITLKGVNHNTVRQEALSICFEESGQSSSHTDSEDVRCHPDDITTMEISKCTDKLSLKYSLSVRYHSLDQEDEEVL